MVHLMASLLLVRGWPCSDFPWLSGRGPVRGRDVQYWAAQFRVWSPADISDLEAIADVPEHSPGEIGGSSPAASPDEPGKP
jgi:hypothetical protein